MMRFWRLVACAALLTGASCTFDTELPQTPMRGRIVGSVDTSKGPALPNAQTVLLSGETGDNRSTLTDANGAFIFADLAPGLYLVSVSVNAYAKATSELIRVNSGQDTDVGVLSPDFLGRIDPATVAGKVVASPVGDVTGAKVEFSFSGVVVAQQVVGPDGLFVQQLPPGTATIKASHPLFQSGELKDLVLTAGQSLDLSARPLVLGLNPATLTGTVYEERDGLEPTPSALADVTLDTGETTKTDAAGNFIISGLPAGVRFVRVSKTGLHDQVPSRQVTLKPNETTALPKVTLLIDRGSIVGTVKLADNGPVSGARVEVAGTNYAAIVSPDAQDPSKGGFVIPSVPAGDWSVTARKDQYSNSTVTVKVKSSEPIDTGVMTLARLLGDFEITDADPANTAGYTRATLVTLDFSKFPSSGVASYRASEDATFDGGTFLPYTGTQQPFTLSPTQGVHTVYAQYKDTQGTVSQTFSSSVVFDDIAPSTPSVSFDATGLVGATKYINQAQNLPLHVSSNDGQGSGIALMKVGDALAAGQVSAASETYAVTSRLSRSAPVDGPATAYVQTVDHAGNVSSVGSDVVFVDTVRPTGSITVLKGPKATDPDYTNQALVTLNVAYGDSSDAGVVLMRIANSSTDLGAAVYAPASNAVGWFLDPTSEGLKTVWAQFRDPAGNETVSVINDAITYDITAPNPAAIALQGPAITRSLTQSLSLTATAAELSTSQALALADESSFTSPATQLIASFPPSATTSYTLPAGEGSRSIFARFRDKAGNDAVASVQLTVDTVAPSGSFTLLGTLADGTASSTITSSSTVTVTITPGGATEYRLSDSTMTSCPAAGYSPLVSNTIGNHPLPANGIVTLCLRDAAGNPQGPLSQTLPLDATAPTGCSLTVTGTKVDGSAAPAGRTANRTVAVTVSACAGATEMALAEGAVTCSNSAGLNWVSFATTGSVNLGGPDGSRPVNGCVRDAARNVASLAGSSITLDTVGPTAPVVLIDLGAAYINDATAVTRGGNIGNITGSAQGAVLWALSENVASFASFSAVAPTQFTFGGTGVRTLYAKFQDDVGNESAIASDTIDIDRSPPSIGGVSFGFLVPIGAQAGFTNDNTVRVTLSSPPADAAAVQVAEFASNCSGSFGAALTRLVQPSFDFVMSNLEGPRVLCARLLDAAGNPSTVMPQVSVTLDTTPPTSPQISTLPALLNATATASFTVTTAGAVTDTNFHRYERSGGVLTGWVDNGGSDRTQSSTSFGYTLLPNRANTLRLRAVDKAGNLSAEDSVVITWDNVAPAAPVTKVAWVDNGDGRSTLTWQKSTSSDVAAYRVHYGPVPGSIPASNPPTGFNGFNAVEGASPLQVVASTAASQSLALTGLTNGATVYATVTAVDAAGNESAAPASTVDLPNRYVVLEPNLVSINRVGRVDLSGNGGAGRVVAASLQGEYLYLVGRSPASWSCASATGGSTLTVVDLGTITPPLSLGTINPTPVMPTVASGPVQYADAIPCVTAAPRRVPLVDVIADGHWLYTASGPFVRIYSLANPGQPALYATLDLRNNATPVNPVQQLSLVGDRLFVSGDPHVVAINVSKLFDSDASTVPAIPADVIGTASSSGNVALWGMGHNVTRDRLVQYTHNGGENAGYILGPALQTPPTAFNSTTSFIAAGSGTTYLESTSTIRHVAAGNFLYFTSAAELSVYRLNTLWSSTTAGPGLASTTLYQQAQIPGGDAIEVQGGQAFITVSSGVRSVDLSDITQMTETSYSVLSGGTIGSTVTTFGNWLLLGGNNELNVAELATPRSMHVVASGSGGGPYAEVGPGFLYSGNGRVHDLHAGSQLTALAPAADTAGVFDDYLYDMARFDGRMVTAQGNGIAIFNVEDQTDRSAGTVYDVNDSVLVQHPVATTKVTGVEAYGNHLIASEVRSDGVYVEVFDARPFRNRYAAAFDFNTHSRGAFRVVALTPTAGLWASLSVTNGRAVVSLDEAANGAQVSPGVYIVDLRPLLDDAAGGTPSVLGSLALTAVRETVVRGNYLAAGTSAGTVLVDVTNAMAEPPTALPASPPTVVVPTTGNTDAVQMFGSYLFQVMRGGQNVRAIDAHDPSSPQVLSTAPLPVNSFSAYGLLENGPTKQYRVGLTVRGSRLYYTTRDTVRVLELE